MLLAAFLALAPSPDFITTLVWSQSGRCVYQTGDVFLGAADFRGNLIGAARSYRGIFIFHPPNVPRRCLNTARRIAREAGFAEIRVGLAPADLNMRPPA
jgi:hypothetical protein